MSFAALMVHVELERDCEHRVELALRLADRFGALIGVAGFEPRPTFMAGGIAVYADPAHCEARRMTARFEEIGKKFCARGGDLKHIEWRSSLCPSADLLLREARAADLMIVGARHRAGTIADLDDPGAILLRAGRPVLVVPDNVAALALRRVLVACKDTRECRRAVCDAIPLLQRADESCCSGLGEHDTESQGKKCWPTSGIISSATA